MARTEIVPGRGRVHEALLEATRDVHARLHRHPRLARLMRADLRLEEYLAILEAHRGFFAGIEARREELACWPQFTLAPALERLERDLGPRRTAQADDMGWIEAPLGVLALLYMAHGSRHGGVAIGRCVARALPRAPSAYFGWGLDAEAWGALLAALERAPADDAELAHLARTARRGFERFEAWVSRPG